MLDPSVRRRTLLGGALAALGAALLGGCGASNGEAATPAKQPPLPPLATAPLAGLVASAGLRWVLLAAPRELYGVAWIPPLVDLAVSGARFDRFAQGTGIDLRTLPEAVVASSAPAGSPASGAASGAAVSGAAAASEDVVFYLARHTGDASLIERALRARFTSSEKRAVDRPDLVRVSGKIGTETHAAVFLGRDVAGFQEGGSVGRGPARVAALFAEGKLKQALPALGAEPLRSLAARLGAAPLAAFAPGPFDGDVAKGLRGLLGAATGVGAVLRPSVRQGFLVTVAVAGDFTTSGEPAKKELLAAWTELAASGLGHMLGLDAPVTAPVTVAAPDAVMLSVELSGRALAEGLAKATASRVEDIFR